MNKNIRTTLAVLAIGFAMVLVVGLGPAKGSILKSSDDSEAALATSSHARAVPDNCIRLSSGELECRDDLTQSLSISI
jgi:hypothetical protein